MPMENTQTEPDLSNSRPAVHYLSTPDRQGLLGQLRHLLQFGDGIPVLVGAPGSGKSILLEQLATTLEGVEFCTLYRIEAQSSLIENLVQVSSLLGIQTGDSASSGVTESTNAGAMLVALRHYGQALCSDQKQGVLLLDDAHHLDDSALAAFVSLSQIDQSSSHGLSLLFSGRPGLVERLDDLRILEVPIYDFTVPALSADELASFLKLPGVLSPAIKSAGVVNPESVRRLWASTLGNPGTALRLLESEVNTYSKSSLLAIPAWLKSWRGIPLGHILAVALLSIVVAVTLIFRGSGESVDDIKPPLKPPSFTPLNKSSSSTREQSASAASSSQKQLPEQPEAAEQSGGSGFRPGGQDASVSEGITKKMAVIDTEMKSETEPQFSSSSSSAPVPVVAPVSVAASSRSTVLSTPVAPLREPPRKSASSSVAAAKPQQFSSDESYILEQDDNAYTLQVLAASKKSSLTGYIERQPNRDQLYLFKGTRNGKDWYVVVSGVFPTRADALKGIKSLPAAQRKAGPWPRKLGKIKAEILESTQ